LDNISFIECTGGELDSFNLGSLANYGDSRIQKRIKSEIYDPRKFFDILTELQLAAWHLSHGHEVQALPDGADHLVTIPSWKLPIASECKRLAKDTKISRVSSVMKKANKQIKSSNTPGHGIAVIDASEKIENGILSNQFSNDGFPPELREIRKEVTKSLYSYNSSVSAALLIWQRISIMKSMEAESGHIFVVLQFHSSIVRHRNPLFPLGDDLSPLNFGNNVEFSITLHKS
jgi:hypothetical protein